MGVFDRLFEAVASQPDLEWLMIDATVIRAQSQAAGARRKRGDLKPSGKPVIPPRRHRRYQHAYDKIAYRNRWGIEGFFAKLKQWRALVEDHIVKLVRIIGAISVASFTKPRNVAASLS